MGAATVASSGSGLYSLSQSAVTVLSVCLEPAGSASGVIFVLFMPSGPFGAEESVSTLLLPMTVNLWFEDIVFSTRVAPPAPDDAARLWSKDSVFSTLLWDTPFKLMPARMMVRTIRTWFVSAMKAF